MTNGFDSESLPDGWRADRDETGTLISILDRSVRLRQVPSGQYEVGLTASQHEAALAIDPIPNLTFEEITPVLTYDVSSLFAGEIPVTNRVARAAGIPNIVGPEARPAMLTFEESLEVVEGLGCRLPTELELEIMVRGGTYTLFPWGDSVPDRSALARWLAWDLEPVEITNAWGFGGLFFGEWCSDLFRPIRPDGPIPDETVHTVKGGGSQFWPWQDAGEWVWCMPAMRMPSSNLFDDRRCAVRPFWSGRSQNRPSQPM